MWSSEKELAWLMYFHYIEYMDPLIRIKRLILAGKVFTEKAEAEIAEDHLSKNLVYEAIWNVPAINKTIRSKNPKTGKREMLYIIKGLTFDGLAIYTKEKNLSKAGNFLCPHIFKKIN